MAQVVVDTEILKVLIKESVTEAIKAERQYFFERLIPEVSELEMTDIIKHYGQKPEKKEFVDMTEWLKDEN